MGLKDMLMEALEEHILWEFENQSYGTTGRAMILNVRRKREERRNQAYRRNAFGLRCGAELNCKP